MRVCHPSSLKSVLRDKSLSILAEKAAHNKFKCHPNDKELHRTDKVWHILFVIDVSHMSHNNIGFLSHVIFSTIKKVKLIHNKHNQSIKNVKRQDRRLGAC